MQKINFEPIGKAMQAFDTDKMDIYRRVEITNPDGTTGESSMEEPLSPLRAFLKPSEYPIMRCSGALW